MSWLRDNLNEVRQEYIEQDQVGGKKIWETKHSRSMGDGPPMVLILFMAERLKFYNTLS